MLFVFAEQLRVPDGLNFLALHSDGTVRDSAVAAARRNAGIRVDKQLGVAVQLAVDDSVYQRNFVMYPIKVVIIRQSDVTIDVELVTVSLNPKVMHINPIVFTVVLKDTGDVSHQLQVRLVH